MTVDYSRYYVDPRPYSQQAMTQLAQAARTRMLADREQEQNAIVNQQRQKQQDLGLANFRADQQQRGVDNRLAQSKLALAQKQQQSQQGIANRQQSLAEHKEYIDTVAGLISQVNNEEDYQVYRQQLAELVQKGALPKQYLDSTPEAYNQKSIDQVKKALGAVTGKDLFSTPEKKGGITTQRNLITGEEKVLDRESKRQTRPDPYDTSDYKMLNESISDINKKIADGTRKNEFGEYVPLTDLEKKQLTFQKRTLEMQKAEIRGQKQEPIVRSVQDVEDAIQIGAIKTGPTKLEQRSALRDQVKNGLVSEDAAVDFAKKYKLFEDDPVDEKPAEQKKSEKKQPAQKTSYTTDEVKKSLEGESGKRTGWDVLKGNLTDEEKEAMKRNRQNRISKSFLRKPPI
jgi:hypothetical protein